jgi:uncharacterized protein YjbI with pentapeptide repeats
VCNDDEISYREVIRLDDLIGRYNAGERDFSRVLVESPNPVTIKDSSGKSRVISVERDFKGLDLSGIILRDSNLLSIRLDLEGTILHGADLSNVDLGEFYAPNIDLSNAILRGTRYWQDSTFDHANFSGSDMTGANFVSADFSGIDMSRVNLDNSKIRTTRFVCNFIDSTIRNSRLEHVTFSRCKLIRTDFRGSEFVSRIEFRECSFEETIMPDGSIRNS